MKSLYSFLICMMVAHAVLAQTDSVLSRIVLIGDGGALKDGKHPVSSWVKNNISLDAKTLILFFGRQPLPGGITR